MDWQLKFKFMNNKLSTAFTKSNNLLTEFSFSNSSTLSVLFKSYCMNIYGCTLWRYNNHSNIANFCVSQRKIVRRLWKTPGYIKIKAHNSLVHLINNCVSIDCILKKKCVKKFYILFCKMNSSNNKIIRKPTVCFITHVAG